MLLIACFDLLAGVAFAGATPAVCWTSDATATCGCPAADTSASIEAPTTAFRLFVEPGSARYSGLACQFAAAEPDGDEVCALAIGLEATHADVALSGFTANSALSPGVVSNLIRSNNLVINFFNAAGQSGCLELGTVSVSHATDAGGISPSIQLTETTSEWTNAALGTEVFPVMVLPEPSFPLLLMLGALVLQRGARGRGRRDSPGAHGRRFALLTSLAGLLIPGGAGAFEYFDLNAFLARAGPAAVRLDLTGYPLDDAGFNVFGANPQERRGIEISAPGVQTLLPFPELGGKAAGTFLIFDPGVGPWGPVAAPGGTMVQDDRVLLQFASPVRGAGVRVIDATDPDGAALTADDKVLFLDAYGGILAGYPLSDVKQGRSAFVGYVARPGSLPVAAIEIVESDGFGPPDDIWIDDIVYLSTPDPYVDRWRNYSPGTAGGPLALPSQEDPALSLDAPDGRLFEFSPTGSIILGFTDNALVASGDAAADLRFYAQASPGTKVEVEISEDGTNWIFVDSISGGTVTDFDIDSSFNVVPATQYAFVRLTSSSGASAPPLLIDAVEALSSSKIEDGDFDGAADAFDNCPLVSNPSQADDDGDGVGNRCDVCRNAADPAQADSNGDGVGDACEGPRLELVLDPPPSPVGNQLTGGDLYLDCGGADVQSLNFAVVPPPGTSSFVFGVAAGDPSITGCAAPPAENPYSPFTVDSGCLGATALGTTLDPARSGAVLGDPGTGDPEAFYLFLEGVTDAFGTPTPICAAGDPAVPLGRVNFVASMNNPAATRVSLGQWGSLLDWFDASGFSDPARPLSTRVTQGRGALRQGLQGSSAQPAMSFASSESSPFGFMTSAATVSTPADVVLELRQSSSVESASGEAWDLCITDESLVRMGKITIGIEGPAGASGTADMFLMGCEDPAPVGGLLNCSKDSVSIGSTIDEASSYGFGPVTLASGDLFGSLQDSTLYVSLSGSYSDTFATGLLNASTTSSTCVATVVVADPTHIPSLTLVGVDDLEASPFVDETGVASDPDFVVVRNTSYDADGDSILEGDNCVLVANADQLNSGGFQSSVSDTDLDGDACECGDGNATGAVWQSGVEGTADVDAIRSYLASLSSDVTTRMKCSAIDTTTCNMADVVAWYGGLTSGVSIGDGACEAVSGAEPE